MFWIYNLNKKLLGISAVLLTYAYQCLPSLYRKTALRLETSEFGLSHVRGIQGCLLTL